MILAPLQKLRNNVGDLGKIILTTIFKWLPKVQKIAQSGHTAGDGPFKLIRGKNDKFQPLYCHLVYQCLQILLDL